MGEKILENQSSNGLKWIVEINIRMINKVSDTISCRMIFFIVAFYTGLWTIRIPDIKDQISTDYLGIGYIFFAFALGSALVSFIYKVNLSNLLGLMELSPFLIQFDIYTRNGGVVSDLATHWEYIQIIKEDIKNLFLILRLVKIYL